ncbi:MAG: lipoprotein NlpD [Gammaproteobacteria bacterium]|jgi:lipoprotein NlpD
MRAHRQVRRLVLVIAVMTAVLASGCANYAGRAPVGRDASQAPRPISSVRLTKNFYTVRRDDTLYSIAFRAGVDFRNLAAWNNISSPHVIYPGQRLALTPNKPAKTRATPTPKVSPRSGSVAPPKTATARSVATRPKPNSVKKRSSQTTKAAPHRPSTTSASRPQRARETPAHESVSTDNNRVIWNWPIKGEIIRRYSQEGNRGLDIGGRSGSTIRAAAHGKVVYSGSGLIGYGKLIIIKHNERFLTAYAHNRTILVSEGEVVKRGAPVARMGSSGTSRVKLHFEIRKDGRPVDPLRYLPKR